MQTLISPHLYEDAAARLSSNAGQRVDVAAIQAVATVEAGVLGPWVRHRGEAKPTLLFEPHIFYRETGDVPYSKTHPWLSSPRWDKALYNKTGGEPVLPGEYRQWVKFGQAQALDKGAAIRSCSFGLFQVMGFHWKRLRYESEQDFYARMHHSVEEHFEAFLRYNIHFGLAGHLARLDFTGYAKAYNGAGYAANQYDVKMEREYRRWKKVNEEAGTEKSAKAIAAIVKQQADGAVIAGSVRETTPFHLGLSPVEETEPETWMPNGGRYLEAGAFVPPTPEQAADFYLGITPFVPSP